MNHSPASGRRDSGFAIVSTLLVMVLVAVSLTLVATALSLRLKAFDDGYQALKLTTLADAGLAEALGNLQADPAFPGFDEYDFGGGKVESTVTPMGGRRVEVVVTAKFRGRQRNTSAMVRLSNGNARVLSWQLVRPVEEEDPQDGPTTEPSRASISP
ncbi:MAG: hypothetical protein K0U98_20110 [Deltaproteobacteria bacterium]|nr:hypothetical protein [Deltaproteobacteria bacterium]